MFFCSYCQIEHDDNLQAVEHIIPQVLLNKNYVLKSTCDFWNHYMSHSFEQGVVHSDLMKEILHIFNPKRSKKLIPLGELQTARRTTEYRYYQNGNEFLCNRPEYETTNEFSLILFDSEENQHIYNLILPFRLTIKAKGSERLLNPNNRINFEEAKLHEYITKLYYNPTKNPDLYVYMKKSESPPAERVASGSPPEGGIFVRKAPLGL